MINHKIPKLLEHMINYDLNINLRLINRPKTNENGKTFSSYRESSLLSIKTLYKIWKIFSRYYYVHVCTIVYE